MREIPTDQRKPVILFTAFEPSGDSHAAPVIAELKRRFPDLGVYAWGGPKMEAAGARVVERSADDGAMGLGALTRARAVRRHMNAIRRWAGQNRVVVHVPVDSPAANFPICKALRKQGVRTVHLVAPQIWAWGGWRIGKLRKRTDLVLCLLPFEEKWFRERGVPARFIGHPRINRDLDLDALDDDASMLPQGAPKVAIFPGSRTQEVRKNLRLLIAVYRELQARHATVSGIVVAARPQIAKYIKSKTSVMPTNLHIVTVNPDVAVYWCDFALTVSGTMSLDIARQARPMVGVYKVGRLSRALSGLFLRTKHRLLPNIIAGRRIVPEFVPYAGGEMPIVEAATPFLADSKPGVQQQAELRRILELYKGKQPDVEAADLIVEVAKGRTFT